MTRIYESNLVQNRARSEPEERVSTKKVHNRG